MTSLKIVIAFENGSKLSKLEGGYRSPMAASSQLSQQEGETLGLQSFCVGFGVFKSTHEWMRLYHVSLQIISPAWVSSIVSAAAIRFSINL